MAGSPPGSSVHGIFKARILEWVAISFPGDRPNSGMELMSPVSSALAGRFFTTEPSGKARCNTKPYRYWKKKKKNESVSNTITLGSLHLSGL